MDATIADPMSFTKAVTPDGVTVYHQYRPLPWFMVRAIVWAGKRDDLPGKEGVAHLVEHHLTQTDGPSHPGGSIPLCRWLDEHRIQAYLGTTGVNCTSYGFRARNEQASDGFSFLGTHILGATMDGDFEHDKEIVCRERDQRTGPRIRNFWRESEEILLRGHPLAAMTGIPEDPEIAALTIEDAAAYYRAWYVPNNVSVVVIGGITAVDAWCQIERCFAGPPKTVPKRVLVDPAVFQSPCKTKELRYEVSGKKSETTEVSFVWGCDAGPPSFTRLLARATLTHLLFFEARERQRLCYTLRVSSDSFGDYAEFNIRMVTSPEKEDAARACIIDCLRDATAIASSFPAAKRHLLDECFYDEYPVAQTLDETMDWLETRGSTVTLHEAIEGFERVTVDDVLEFIRTSLDLRLGFITVFET